MDIGFEREVNFSENCKNCEHYDVPECEDPCHECMDTPVREYTTKPLYFEERQKSK